MLIIESTALRGLFLMKKLLLALFTVLILIYSSADAWACGCPTVGPLGYVEGKFKYSSAVFSGEVLSIVSGGSRRKVTIQVAEYWKGPVTSNFTVETPLTYSSCSYNFEVGRKYLVFADLWENRHSTGACSGNRALENAETELKILGKGKRPRTPGYKK